MALVKVWDRFVRCFHWALAGVVVANLFVLESGDPPHRYSGYVAVGLIVTRIIWGFVGSTHARFSSFWPSVSGLRAECRAMLRLQPVRTLGHSQLGAVVMMAMCLLVLGLGVTGYLQTTDVFFGEDWVSDVHEFLAECLQFLVVVHVLAAVVLGLLHRENLIAAMWTGFKRH